MNHSRVVPFLFHNHEVRVIKDEQGEPWFVAKDVCEALDILLRTRWTEANLYRLRRQPRSRRNQPKLEPLEPPCERLAAWVLCRSFDELDWPDEVVRAVGRIRTMIRDQYRLLQADQVEL